MAKRTQPEVSIVENDRVKQEAAQLKLEEREANARAQILPGYDGDDDEDDDAEPLAAKPAAYAPDPPRAKVIPNTFPNDATAGTLDLPCGLPKALMTRKALIAYVNQYGYGHNDRKRLVITNRERAYWDLYYQAAGPIESVSKEFFVVALRLWKNGYSIDPKQQADINAMQVN